MIRRLLISIRYKKKFYILTLTCTNQIIRSYFKLNTVAIRFYVIRRYINFRRVNEEGIALYVRIIGWDFKLEEKLSLYASNALIWSRKHVFLFFYDSHISIRVILRHRICPFMCVVSLCAYFVSLVLRQLAVSHLHTIHACMYRPINCTVYSQAITFNLSSNRYRRNV